MGRYQLQTTGILGGLNEDENPDGPKNGELIVAENIRRVGNMIGTRQGLRPLPSGSDFENQINSTSVAVQGMIEWRSDFDQNRKLLVLADRAGTVVVWLTDTTFFTNVGGSGIPAMTVGADNLWTFAVHNNILYSAGGAEAADQFWSLDPADVANDQSKVRQSAEQCKLFCWYAKSRKIGLIRIVIGLC